MVGMPVLHTADSSAAVSALQAPNVVVISDQLVTSGQPSVRTLSQLKAQGFDVVLYLAPPSVSDAVADEPSILQGQGVEYINFPIRFASPTAEDFAAVSAVLTRFKDKKVLVHCQVNMRASTMVFLHRVIVDNVAPEKAYESVTAVWSPQGPWRVLIIDLLRQHQIAFEPF
jgi:protein tyrosine phosphatase (PTP) superfamily phosphohydrolase (DUF442 family)